VFDTQLQGIGGWLLLPAFGLLVAPFRLLMDLSRLLPSYATDNWTQLTTVGGDAYHAMWAPVLLFELANTMGYLVFMSLLLVMFFQKRRVVPLFYPVLLGSNVLIQGIDIALVQSIPSAASAVTGKDWGELLRGALFFAIWASYFRMSQRVKATFVHGRDTPKSAPAITPTPTPETTAT
jgi:hypothetical protein